MSVRINEIDKLMCDIAPKYLSEPWDNDGIMVCGDVGREVKCAAVCLEVSDEAVDFAVREGAEVIVTHHPYIFRPLKSVKGNTFSTIEKLMKNGISVLSYHTRLDKADGGVNDVLAEKLGLSDIEKYGESADDKQPMGRIGTLPEEMSADEFAEYIAETLGADGLRYAAPKGGKAVKRVAVLGGAGKDFLAGAYAAGADAFVSGDLSHNTYLDGSEMGLVTVDAGHYATENPITEKIASLLSEKLGVKTLVFDVKSPYIGITFGE